MPGGKVCSVAVCNSNSKKCKQNQQNIMFFSFPNDPVIRKQWIRNCYRKDKFSTENKRICSKHFKPEDYEDRIKAELMGSQPKRLKKTAVPTLMILPEEKQKKISDAAAKRLERAAVKERKQIIENLLAEHASTQTAGSKDVRNDPKQQNQLKNETTEVLKQKNVFNEKQQNNMTHETSEVLKQQTVFDLHQQNNMIHETPEQLKRQVQLLLEENERLRSANKSLILRLDNLEKKMKKEQERLSFVDRAKLAFKTFLSPTQIDYVLKNKTKGKWTNEDFSRAFMLRYLGKSTYIYLRQNLKYPLPGVSTLRKWVSNLDLKSGLLTDIFGIMEAVGKDKTELGKITVLSFDEMKVQSKYEYDHRRDEIIGPHSYVQVVMARGLFGKWKQPVFVGFDTTMTRDVLDSVISALNNIKYRVVACVTNCDAKNEELWKELQIDYMTCYQHPISRDPIYFFTDVSHSLRMLRDWFIACGFVLNDGTFISKTPIQKVIDSSDFGHGLSPRLLNSSKTENVRQLFSKVTVNALKRYQPGKDVAKFIQLVSDWFELMASFCSTRKPYGSQLDSQNNVLNEMKYTVRDLMCRSDPTMQTFQKGIVMSINSLQNLYSSLKEKLPVTHIVTQRLGQGCLKNFFLQLGAKDESQDQPSPLSVLYRIRIILLSKNPAVVEKYIPKKYLETGEENYVLSAAFKKADITNDVVEEPHTTDEDFLASSEERLDRTSPSAASPTETIDIDDSLCIADYLARHHFKTYPYLGGYIHKNDALNVHSYSKPIWKEKVSFESLFLTSNEWISQVEKMDGHFIEFFKDYSDLRKDVLKCTVEYVTECVADFKIPKQLIFEFCKLRLLIRIKQMNKEEGKTDLKRKLSFDKPDSDAKKMKMNCKVTVLKI